MLSEAFEKRMKAILGEEYESFSSSLDEPAVKGARVNTEKCDVEAFVNNTELKLTPLPYSEDGFILRDHEGIGNTPEHHAGMIYVQDPGAMATVCAAEISDGLHVCDLCAAPGGKSGQIAAKIKNGFLLSNEYVPKRAKIVVSNFERL
jgi:16S rRNA C967 or C1407 C5-methylase (RsmB/RsmF family)